MLDGMTNVKASEVLKELKMYSEDLPHYSPDEVSEALEMGSKALEQPTVDDCISRQEVLCQLNTLIVHLDGYHQNNQAINNAMAEVMSLPSVTPSDKALKEAYLKGYDYGVKDWFVNRTKENEGDKN